MLRVEASETEPVRAGKRRPGALLLSSVAITALFAIVMFAAAAQGRPQFGAWPLDGPVQEPREEAASPLPMDTSPPIEPPADSPLATIVGTVLATLIIAVVLTVAFLGLRQLIRFLRRLWRDRPLARQNAALTDTLPARGAMTDADPDAAAIRRGIDGALRTIDARPAPGDGIVAAWVGLEESASDAGTPRASNETPSEFTARIIGGRAGVASDVRTLLALYEAVRFGGHDADEQDRQTAAACLRGVQAAWR